MAFDHTDTITALEEAKDNGLNSRAFVKKLCHEVHDTFMLRECAGKARSHFPNDEATRDKVALFMADLGTDVMQDELMRGSSCEDAVERACVVSREALQWLSYHFGNDLSEGQRLRRAIRELLDEQ